MWYHREPIAEETANFFTPKNRERGEREREIQIGGGGGKGIRFLSD